MSASDEDWDDLLCEAQDALFEQRFADSIEHCQKANKMRPFSPEVLNILLVCYEQTGDHTEALKTGQEWVSNTKGKNTQALAHVVRESFACQDSDALNHAVETILNVLETTTDDERQEALAYYAWTGFAQLVELGDALRISPSSYEGLVNFGYEHGTPPHIFHGFIEAKEHSNFAILKEATHQTASDKSLAVALHIYALSFVNNDTEAKKLLAAAEADKLLSEQDLAYAKALVNKSCFEGIVARLHPLLRLSAQRLQRQD
eukprot:CAMPEP_0177653308 /NCGR_PEP_ID=MMETSP0447-20121125/13663_1 /TAXON_ID=0 /ORGANISM="Stygamoeba regulata, Strain BSH-02190019" /LENGTH=259 /DNA_ID=CAMNT_0019156749 /DNA_START=20 /DNA_END=799 /DNA_ORIENTATION=-